MNSGDYVSLKKENEDFDDIEMAAETERIKTKILNKNKEKEDRKAKNRTYMNGNGDNIDDSYVAEPEEEEVDNWEKSILKQTISSSK